MHYFGRICLFCILLSFFADCEFVNRPLAPFFVILFDLCATLSFFTPLRQILPLILMFVMFGPVALTGLVFVYDYVATSEWGVKIGLSDDPRTRLTKFYKKHNPTKMRDVREGENRRR